MMEMRDSKWIQVKSCYVPICSKFRQLCFCHILVDLVYSWESYCKNKGRVNFLIHNILISNSSKTLSIKLYLLSQLAANVTETFCPIEAHGLQTTVTQHLCHLGVLCVTKTQTLYAIASKASQVNLLKTGNCLSQTKYIPLLVSICNACVSRAAVAKLLGVCLRHNLNFLEHAESAVANCNQRLPVSTTYKVLKYLK